MTTNYIHIILILLSSIFIDVYSYSQDTLTIEIDKTVGGCPINHPNKKINYAPSPNCGIVPIIRKDSIQTIYISGHAEVVFVKYFGLLDEADKPVMYKMIEYDFYNGKIHKTTVTTYNPGFKLPYAIGISNDTMSSYTNYHSNGNKLSETIHLYPNGEPDPHSDRRIEYDFNEDGKILAERNYIGDKLNGDYYQYDDSSFVTHWIYKNDKLIDIKNQNCRYLDSEGKLITKEQFFRLYETEEFGQWGYYLFENFEPYSNLNCVDYVMYSNKWPIPSPLEGKKAKNLIRRLNNTCH